MEQSSARHEAHSGLRYPQGWHELFEAPDAADYGLWLSGLSDLTRRRLSEAGDLSMGGEEILFRWQQAIELVADTTIDPEDDLSEAERIETALLTFQANVESIGWDDEGLAFAVPNMLTGEEASIDLRELPGLPSSQSATE